MSDLISRQDAIDLVRDVCDAILSECGCHYDSEVEDEVYDDIHEVSTILKCNKAIRKSLMDLPSAQQELPDTNVGDIVPVIRCRDCKRWKTDHPTANGYHCCHRLHNAFPMREDDFCSRAERREV